MVVSYEIQPGVGQDEVVTEATDGTTIDDERNLLCNVFKPLL